MVREVVKADCGVIFDETAVAQWNIQEDDLKPTARRQSKSAGDEGTTSQQHVNSGEEHRSASGMANSHVSDNSAVREFFSPDDALEDRGDTPFELEELKGYSVVDF